MLKNLLALIFFLMLTASMGQNITLNGTIKDIENGQTLIGVNVFDRITQKGAVTNNYGNYSYTTTRGGVELIH